MFPQAKLDGIYNWIKLFSVRYNLKLYVESRLILICKGLNTFSPYFIYKNTCTIFWFLTNGLIHFPERYGSPIIHLWPVLIASLPKKQKSSKPRQRSLSNQSTKRTSSIHLISFSNLQRAWFHLCLNFYTYKTGNPGISSGEKNVKLKCVRWSVLQQRQEEYCNQLSICWHGL